MISDTGLMFQLITLLLYNLTSVQGLPLSNTTKYGTFDFIIVGAGSAGAVVASRLSENVNFTVLLLEAGQTDFVNQLRSEIPAAALQLKGSSYDWQYVSEPQINASLGYKDQKFKYPRGKALGGTSTINSMIYIRGNKMDFDNWASMGNRGWSFDEVLPYFKRSEDNRDSLIAADTTYHGTGGYLTVSSIQKQAGSGLIDAFLEAANELNITTGDVNGERQTRATIYQATLRDGFRCSTAKAFLQPAAKRPNIAIIEGALVTQIVFDGNKTAKGVRFDRSGVLYEAFANKEVIVSGGAINSPQLLLLSGIGDRKQLEQFDVRKVEKTNSPITSQSPDYDQCIRGMIPLVAEVPGVGENFHDQANAVGLYWTFKRSLLLSAEKIRLTIESIKWVLSGKGLPFIVPTEGIVYFQTPFVTKDDWPDIQTSFRQGNLGYITSLAHNASEQNNELYYRFVASVQNKSEHSFNLYTSLVQPKSRGYIRLKSGDPRDPPLIDPKLLNHPDDIKNLVAGMKEVIQFGNSLAFKKYGAEFYSPILPTCENEKPLTDEYLECSARLFTLVSSHPAGSCKMGPIESDRMAVVNYDLRVRGVKGLRVIDASIMPQVVNANTNAAAIMIGEKGADLIKETWEIKKNN